MAASINVKSTNHLYGFKYFKRIFIHHHLEKIIDEIKTIFFINQIMHVGLIVKIGNNQMAFYELNDFLKYK